MKDKILIGLSGGVDSSVSLKILKDKGFKVEGGDAAQLTVYRPLEV